MVQMRSAGRVVGDCSPYPSIPDVLVKLGKRTLKQRHADSKLVLFYKKFVCGYVAVPLSTHVIKKGKKKLPGGVPQSHVAANLLHQEEEERDTNQQVQNKQMHEKHTDQFSVPQAKD